MALWNIIRDFYVQYIFGGVDSELNVFGGIVQGYEGDIVDSSQLSFTLNNFYVDSQEPYYISLGDWLSTTFTIITLILFVFFLYVFLRWLFKVVSGLILLRN